MPAVPLPIPAPRQPADDAGAHAVQQHDFDEACNPQQVQAFRALASRTGR